jgi:hypothetical protein
VQRQNAQRFARTDLRELPAVDAFVQHGLNTERDPLHVAGRDRVVAVRQPCGGCKLLDGVRIALAERNRAPISRRHIDGLDGRGAAEKIEV